jgi:alcohol dehydrogenase, propanol-preferring
MQAMVLKAPKTPLKLMRVPIPEPQKGEVLLKVAACGVCRTDLHIVDGELTHPKLPLILGHQIVGIVQNQGQKFKPGDRVGVPWLGKTCGTCRFCRSGRENLCENAAFTGYQIDGGFAEYCKADENFCFPLPKEYADIPIAPLLCGGLIGYRAYRMAAQAQKIGFYGFGSAAHILLQVAKHQGKEVFAFTRKGDIEAQKLALKLGAVWAGSSEEAPPALLDAAIIFAPVGPLVPQALKCLDKGGSVVCAGIHMSDIPAFPYERIYDERIVRSVANLTREDGIDFFKMAAKCKIETQVAVYPLAKTNQALDDLRSGKFTGSAVIDLNLD